MGALVIALLHEPTLARPSQIQHHGHGDAYKFLWNNTHKSAKKCTLRLSLVIEKEEK